MSLETTCTECRRIVGVVRAPSMGREPPRYKVAIHADRDPTPGRGKERRPRCHGTGLEPHPAALVTVSTGPEQRRRDARAAAVAARAGR